MSEIDLQPVYFTSRSAIVKPERVVPTTLYFIQKWLPLLGVERWALIQVLRGLCIDSPRRQDGTKRVAVSWRALADMVDVHEETIARWLQHEPIPDDKPWRRLVADDEQGKGLSLFIPRLKYAYTSTGGKTRRTGFILEILMEDPLTPEDEKNLEENPQILFPPEETPRPRRKQSPATKKDKNDTQESLPANPDVNRDSVGSQSVKPQNTDLQTESINRQNTDLLAGVNRQNVVSREAVKQENTDLWVREPAKCGKNVITIYIDSIDRTIKSETQLQETLIPVIECAEHLLDDYHSTAMFRKVLMQLYPDNLNLFDEALQTALDICGDDEDANRGAMFVTVLRSLAEEAGVDPGLKFSKLSTGEIDDTNAETNDHNNGQKPPGRKSTPEETVWMDAQRLLERQMTRSAFDSFIRDVRVMQYHDDTFTLGVHNMLAKEWLENRLRDTVCLAIKDVLGKDVTVKFSLM